MQRCRSRVYVQIAAGGRLHYQVDVGGNCLAQLPEGKRQTNAVGAEADKCPSEAEPRCYAVCQGVGEHYEHEYYGGNEQEYGPSHSPAVVAC